MTVKTSPAALMVTYSNLAQVIKSLEFLVSMGIVKPDAVAKGSRKFVADHPEIQAHFDSLHEDALASLFPRQTSAQPGEKHRG